MNGGAGKPFFSPEGVGDFHVVVVYDYGEVISGHPVRLEKNFVIDAVGGKGYLSPDEVGEVNFFSGGDLYAYDMRGAGSQQPLNFFCGQAKRVLHPGTKNVVVLGGGVFGRLVVGTHFFELFGCIEGVIGVSLLYELLSVLLIESFRLALALAIGAIGAGMEGALVGVESAPGEAVEDIFFGPGYVAALVGVFNTEDKVAMVLACEKIVV